MRVTRQASKFVNAGQREETSELGGSPLSPIRVPRGVRPLTLHVLLFATRLQKHPLASSRTPRRRTPYCPPLSRFLKTTGEVVAHLEIRGCVWRGYRKRIVRRGEDDESAAGRRDVEGTAG